MVTVLKRIRRQHGMSARIARELGINPSAVSQWTEVPYNRVLDVERITGIPRHVLRPDIYPPDREPPVSPLAAVVSLRTAA